MKNKNEKKKNKPESIPFGAANVFFFFSVFL